MDAILFSVDPKIVVVDDAIRHLETHPELYWESGLRLVRDKFKFPMLGYMHMKGRLVEYVATIKDIVPFSLRHYEDDDFSYTIKPVTWVQRWREKSPESRAHDWKCAFVMTQIEPFAYNTYLFEKWSGGKVLRPPQNYIKVLQVPR